MKHRFYAQAAGAKRSAPYRVFASEGFFMKNKLTLLLVLLASLAALNLAAQGTAFTYQGFLQNNGSPASGTFSFTFSLYATNTNGIALAGPITNGGVGVSNGLFTATIDFGTNAFTGSNVWLQIGVATNGVSTFTSLTPRQLLTPTPYAVFAGNGVFTGDYGGGTPTVVPPTPGASAIDTSNGRIWWYYNSSWH